MDEFLEKMSKIYEIVIYTASLPLYADKLIDLIDKKHLISHRLFRDQCTVYNGSAFVKDLSLLGRDIRQTIIVDNSPVSYMFQPENAIPIVTWISDQNDTCLYDLTNILDLLAKFSDITKIIPLVFPENGNNLMPNYTRVLENINRIISNQQQKQKINCEIIQKIMQGHMSPQNAFHKKILDSEEPFHNIKKLVSKIPPLTKKQNLNDILAERNSKPGTPLPRSISKLWDENENIQQVKQNSQNDQFRSETPKTKPRKQSSYYGLSGKKLSLPLENSRKKSGVVFANLLKFKSGTGQIFFKTKLTEISKKVFQRISEQAEKKFRLFKTKRESELYSKNNEILIEENSLPVKNYDSNHIDEIQQISPGTTTNAKIKKQVLLYKNAGLLANASSPFLIKVSQAAGKCLAASNSNPNIHRKINIS